MKISTKILLPLLLAILLSGGILFFQNWKYNNEIHSVSLAGGGYQDDEIEFRVMARGEETGEPASWTYDWVEKDESGNEVHVPCVGTIYEMTVVNKSPNLVKNWNYQLTIPVDTNLSSGWNGDFEIHQFSASGKPNVYTTANFDMSDSTLQSSSYQGCLFIPLEAGDWFGYTPSYIADEVEIPASVSDDEYTSKTIGFILYTRTDDPAYLMHFTEGTAEYCMYCRLFDTRSFRMVCLAFGVWCFAALEILLVNIHTRKIVRQHQRNMKIINESMETFANFIDAKDPNTSGHSIRVAQYSKLIAENLGMEEQECQDIYYIGLLHDCGKISIPQEILMKPGRLDDDEYAVMKSHAQKGADMLMNFKTIPNIGEGACSHHERYDGKGYPNGLKGESIPKIGRIICIADAFDAMNSKRCYRDRLSRDVIISELKKNRGIQFDPELTDLFLGLIDSGKVKIQSQ